MIFPRLRWDPQLFGEVLNLRLGCLEFLTRFAENLLLLRFGSSFQELMLAGRLRFGTNLDFCSKNQVFSNSRLISLTMIGVLY